jgi:hypothetical protein
MAVLGEAFAAVLAEIEERVGARGDTRFLAFPAAPLQIEPAQLVFDPKRLISEGTSESQAAQQAINNLAAFARMVDRVCNRGPQLDAAARQVSEIYEVVINQAIFPTESEQSALDTARRFGDRRTALATARRSSVGLPSFRFLETGFEPRIDIEDATSWTPIAFDAAAIAKKSATLSPIMGEWLGQSGMLAEVAGVALTSARVEICVLKVTRDWFKEPMFDEHDWDLAGERLSDGADPPRGRLPAYVEGLVLARDFRIQLDVAALQTSEETGAAKALARMLIAQREMIDTTGATTTGVPMPGVIARIGPGDPAVVTPVESATSQLPLPVLVDGRAVADRTRVEAEEAARGLAETETELGARIAELSALTDTVAGLRNRLARYPAGVMTVQVRDHRGGAVAESTLDLGPMRAELAAAEARIPTAEMERGELERRVSQQRDVVNDLQETVASYEALARPEERSAVSVLTFLCRPLQKSPDPDPALFAPKA